MGPARNSEQLFVLWLEAWVQSPVVIPTFSSIGSPKFTISLGTISEGPSSFDVQVRYANTDGETVVENHVISGEGSISVVGDPTAATIVSF